MEDKKQHRTVLKLFFLIIFIIIILWLSYRCGGCDLDFILNPPLGTLGQITILDQRQPIVKDEIGNLATITFSVCNP